MCVQICVKHSVSVSPSFMGIQFCIDFFPESLNFWHFYHYVVLLCVIDMVALLGLWYYFYRVMFQPIPYFVNHRCIYGLRQEYMDLVNMLPADLLL